VDRHKRIEESIRRRDDEMRELKKKVKELQTMTEKMFGALNTRIGAEEDWDLEIQLDNLVRRRVELLGR
jgi:hypothetical protein